MPLFSLLPGGGAAIPFVPLFTKACRRHSSALGRYSGLWRVRPCKNM